MLRDLIKTGGFELWTLRKEKEMKKHKLTYLFWETTLRCNFFCKHCGSNAGKSQPNELKEDEIKKVFKRISEVYNPKEIMIAVTGGEPLLRKDLFEVMKHARQLGFPWGMVTNGFLVNQEVVSRMEETGMSTVVVSIDGLEKTHDFFRGVPGSYKKAVEAVKLMAKAKFLKDLQITTSVHKGNINELEQMYKEFLPLGITSWRVMDIDPIGRAEKNKDILISGKELRQLLEFIKEKRKTSPIKITYGCSGFLGFEFEKEVRDNFFICPTGFKVASILYNGDIFVCPNVPREKELIQGNIRKDDFIKVWEEKYSVFRDKNRTSSEDCLKCDWWEECLGNSFHLWDYKKKKTKHCHWQEIN